MKRILIALLLAVCGGFMVREGWRAAHSMMGNVDYYSKGIAYKIDGHIRLPAFALCFAGGLLMLVTGWWMLTQRERSRNHSPGRRRRKAR
jgi:TRAP-type C4-dicarboxylate transport system permease small subunit